MKHSIVITSEKKGLATIPVRQHIKRCITAALDVQGVDVPCEINVLVTDDAGIRAINKAYRDIDRATDVLSFPMFELTPGELPEDWSEYRDPATHKVPLGEGTGRRVWPQRGARGRLPDDPLRPAPAWL